MGYLRSKPATKSEPCPICGKTDHCWSADYGEGGWLHYCAKGGSISVLGRDGNTYLLKDNRAFPGGQYNGYFVYEDAEQQERKRQQYIEKLKRENPNYKYNKNSSYRRENPWNNISQTEVVQKEVVEVDMVKPLPNHKLHEVYSYLLSLLVLENGHRKALLDEWNAGLVNPNLGEEILQKWPIKSLPMNDYARKNCGVKLQNMTRREIIDKMIKRFGSLKGVPGFYLETIRWNDKVTGEPKENTHWQMVKLSGIVYPCYDADGYINRIRIGDEHPQIEEYAKDGNGKYIYEYFDLLKKSDEGYFITYKAGTKIESEHIYQDPKDGSYFLQDRKTGLAQTVYLQKESSGKNLFYASRKHAVCADIYWNSSSGEWFRKDRITGESCIVYSLQKEIGSVKMTAKGYPKIDGKVDGKYKNFSSYSRVEEEKNGQTFAFNKYADGCQSGSPLALYTKEGDDMQYLYVTEGEKKAMVINTFLKCPCISIPGVNTFSKLFEKEYGKDKSIMERQVEKGLLAVIVAFDADKAINPSVMKAQEGLINKIVESGITTFVANWDAKFGLKGADDALIQGKRFEFEDVLEE